MLSMRLHRWAVPLVLIALSGCGGGDSQVVPVTGTLRYKGEPVPNALLNFLPEHGRQGWAVTDERGWFKINYDKHVDGAVIGKHRVWIDYRPRSPAEQDAILTSKTSPLSKDMVEFFKKYNYENSKLIVEIDKATSKLKIDLD